MNLNFLKPRLPSPRFPEWINRAPIVPKQHILHIEPNSRGGISVRWEGDDEQFGNYATVADATRVAEFNFADLVLVSPKLDQAAQSQLATA